MAARSTGAALTTASRPEPAMVAANATDALMAVNLTAAALAVKAESPAVPATLRQHRSPDPPR
eukprot:5330912-Prymnesium_polylepis.1